MAVLMGAIPPHERPRERLLARGAEALTDRELLALVWAAERDGSAVSLAIVRARYLRRRDGA
ncbi:hypothetical protein BH23ACT9_BH23ACT9_09360 [soil metagenome]